MAFEDLSIEVIQTIGRYLDDKDLATYRRMCKSARDAIDHDECSFWRLRFLDSFDPPKNLPPQEEGRLVINEIYKKQYQCRKRTMRRSVNFQLGNTRQEQDYLSLVNDLINESFNVSHNVRRNPQTRSKNMDHVNGIVRAKGLLDRVLRRSNKRKAPPPSPLLLATQLALTHISLTAPPTSEAANVWGFPDAQATAYASSTSRPIFSGSNCTEIDIEWTLHVASFFRNYLLNQQELSFEQYDNLSAVERPQCWTKALTTSPREFGKAWKGLYAYVEHRELEHIRDGLHEKYPVQDHISGENTGDNYQNLNLGFPTGETHYWPEEFERILKSRTKIRYRTAIARAQRRTTGPHVLPCGETVSFSFEGEGEDNSEKFLASGYFNSLPPQQGISGWQRMTMMKYWRDEDTGDIDFSSLWAYEGVVLPGGMIMLGRWWHPDPSNHNNDEYSGPFIFWNVDASMPVA